MYFDPDIMLVPKTPHFSYKAETHPYHQICSDNNNMGVFVPET